MKITGLIIRIMKKLDLIIGMAVWLCGMTACSNEESTEQQKDLISFRLTTEIVPMEGENGISSRVNDEGNSFLSGDLIRLKLITPYAKDLRYSQLGTSTNSASQDNFFLLKWVGASADWSNAISNYGFDVNGNGVAGDNGPSLPYLSQKTPYVFTANTWSECVSFYSTQTSWRIEYKSVFHNDQSIQDNYRASDLLWAQTIMQTATDNVRLSFHHVMSCLEVTLSDANITDAVVSLTGVPNIDRCEVVVGNQYADKDINYGSAFSYAKISYNAQNGVALGVSSFSSSGLTLKAFSDMPTGTYVGYKVSDSTFRFIVPPFTGSNAKIWISTGNKRYSMSLGDNFEFKAGTKHQVSFAVPTGGN